jgi:hypothetical protein
MRRREFISLIGGVAATWPLAVQAQQPVLPVVALLRTTEAAEFIAAFRRGRGFAWPSCSRRRSNRMVAQEAEGCCLIKKIR